MRCQACPGRRGMETPGPVVSTPSDDVFIRKQLPVPLVDALSFGPFGVRSEATNFLHNL